MRHHVLPVFSRPVHGQRGAAGTMNGYELSVRVIGEDRLQWSDDPTDTVLIPMLKTVAGTIQAAAAGPPEQEAIYPPNGTVTASPIG
ncbi:hypothetical protein [uncultured Actinomyces sp.]|uniref:hypothetical protein n=1 Tax=uncultured Actinomyces sp. TaxID=249061 RepID=UPI0028D09019|nr:hypothetical protein [uncultured Actinomyces sp.]